MTREIIKANKLMQKAVFWYESKPWVRGLITAVPSVGGGIHEFLMSTASAYRKINPPVQDSRPYLERIEKAFAVDTFLMSAIGSMSVDAPRNLLYKTYSHLLKGNADEKGVNVTETLSFLEDSKASALFRTNPPSVDLEVKCSDFHKDNISELLFSSEGNNLAKIDNAELLWPCNCKVGEFTVSGEHRDTNESDCPLHSRDEKKQVSEKFESGLVQIEFDEVQVLWRQCDQLWPPSVDTFHMVKDIESSGIIDSKTHSVADIGCGTGYIGIWLAKKFNSIKEVTFSDWLLSPLILTALNAASNLDDTLVSRRYCLGLDIEWVNKLTVDNMSDVLVCNPPYLPNLPGFSELPLASTVFGTDLITNIIRSGHKLAKEVIISFSDLALPEAKKAEKKWGKRLKEIGGPHYVPFRISSVYEKPDYIKLLIDKRGLDYSPDKAFPLYHTLRTYRFVSK